MIRNSINDLERELVRQYEDRHPNVARREFYDQLGTRWLRLALNFTKSKTKIDPDRVAEGIKKHSMLIWPLGRVVIQRTQNMKFRIVSKLSTDLLFDESSFVNHLRYILREEDVVEILQSLEELMGDNRGSNWCDSHLEGKDDKNRERKIVSFMKGPIGKTLDYSTRTYESENFFSASFVISTKISQHSVVGCFKNHPVILGIEYERPFDVENPDNQSGNDLEWVRAVSSIPEVLHYCFMPPASEEIEIFLMSNRSDAEFYAAYEVDFQNLKPDDEMTEDQRKVLKILVKFGIFVLQDVNDKISEALTGILEIPAGHMSDFDDELDEMEEKLDKLHSSFYRIHKFCAHLIVTYMMDERERADMLQELEQKAPLTNHDPDSELDDFLDCFSGAESDSTASNLSESDFAAAADTEDEVDDYLNEIYESD